MSPPQWAYQVENFVCKPDDELICSICHAIFCDPVMCPCDHVFCRVCISKWLQNNRNCPICRKRVPRLSIKQIVPIVKNLIMKLTLYCRNKEHGCESQFTLESCEVHIKECNFELVQCKNKPCKEKLFRKDIDEHEKNGCTHRYIKCESCLQKMSTSTPPEDHNCIRALLFRLRRKNMIIRKKNGEIKELRSEIKTLKEEPHGSVDSLTSPSTISSASISPDEIMINIAEFESLSDLSSDSDDSSDSIVAIIANSASDHSSSDGNQSESFSAFMENFNNDDQHESPLDLSEYRNAGSQTIDESSLHENPEDSHNGSSILPENDSNAENTQNPEAGERSQASKQRRPAKRRLAVPLFSTSEDDNESEGRLSLPSPKRCWRLQSTESNDAAPENTTGDSGGSFMEAGPSRRYQVEASNEGSTSNTKWQFRNRTERSSRTSVTFQKLMKPRKTRRSSKSPQRGNAVFERTLALLEQYNLESDPEWLPEYASHRGNDTTTESDSSYDPDQIADSSSSFSDSDLEYSVRL